MHKLYIFGTIIFCTLTIQGAQQSIIKSVSEQVNDCVFSDYSRFSHEDLMTFGLTCQSNHIYLKTTTEKRKQYILQRYPTALNMFKSISWHGYGSRADCKIIIKDAKSTSTGKRLYIGRLELIDGGKIRKYLGEWKNFDSELSYKPVPFYTINKELRFVGFGWENVPTYGLCGNVICYQAAMIMLDNRTIKQEHTEEAIRCFLCFCGNKDNKQSLGSLLEYPYLLQAILKKGPVEKKILPHYQKDDSYYLYHLQDIIIPHNYKEFVQHTPEQISYKTFDALLKKIQKAVMRQYEKQKNMHHG